MTKSRSHILGKRKKTNGNVPDKRNMTDIGMRARLVSFFVRTGPWVAMYSNLFIKVLESMLEDKSWSPFGLPLKVFLYERPLPGTPTEPVTRPVADLDILAPLGPTDIPSPFFETFRFTPGNNFLRLRN